MGIKPVSPAPPIDTEQAHAYTRDMIAMLDARLRKNLDLWLLLFVVVIVGIGIATLFSATQGSPNRFYQKQVIWAIVGLVALVASASVDYARLPRFSAWFYAINIFLLLVVMFTSTSIKGAQRWINLGFFQMQPSELAKLFVVICLASFLQRRQEQIRELPTLLLSLAYVGLPWLLIFKQPDLGTSLVVLAIWFGMTYIAGARTKHLLAIVAIGAGLFAGMWHFNILKQYQKDRLQVFINPSVDPKDAGYHVIQSRIAVGSGQVWGKGIGQGSQAHGRFIPENHSDFIFTVIGEEGGFLASTLLVALYGGMLFRGAMVMAQAEDTLGKLLATGIVSMFAFHVVVNLGMTIGIMPITGVPLPLVSYGGSSLILNMLAVGLLLSIGMRRHRLVF
jgi:rod shape determining protein RodA